MERARTQRKVPIESLRPNPRNPRKTFSVAELTELSDSVRERGIIQPIVVRPVAGKADAFEIIAGERRWRAAQQAGLHDVPIVALEVTDTQALELAIIENVQRADLNPLEEAAGYQSLIDEFRHNQDAIAKLVGKSRSHVANTLRLLKLSEPIKAHIRSGKLSAGHARMLVGQPNAEQLAEMIVAQGLNVRQVEALARDESKPQSKKTKAKSHIAKDTDTIALEKRLSDALGLKVSMDHRGDGGVLHIQYRDLEQLDAVVRKLES
jgi:ParB family chromosome partitioning protein